MDESNKAGEFPVLPINGWAVAPLLDTSEIMLRPHVEVRPHVFQWTHRYVFSLQAAIALRESLDQHIREIQAAPSGDPSELH